jgi:pimeloyl-ACP methyl ester carboxylesterase
VDDLRLSANGLNFRCLAAGPQSGPLALLLHGFPEGAESWSAQLEPLAAAGLRAVAPDLRGYGGTDCPEGEEAYFWPHLLDDVEGLIQALGQEHCHLVGHDWGALVGWSFASRRPERLMSWSALSVGHPQAFADARLADEDQRRRSEYIKLFRMPGKAEEVLAEDGHRRLRQMYRAGPNPEAIPGAVIDRYVEGFARPYRLTAGLNYYRANLGLESYQRYPPAPHPVRVPTQLVWGDEDPALGRTGTEATGAHVAAEYRLEVLAGAGHWLQFERPAEVSSRLIEWMTAHSAVSR